MYSISHPGANGCDRSSIFMRNAFGAKLGPPGLALPGKVQLIVGFTPLAEFVIVTLCGNGTGVNGIPLVEGNGKVAIVPEGL